MTSDFVGSNMHFITNYYNSLCNNIDDIDEFYTDSSKLIISHEVGNFEVCTSNFCEAIKMKHPKSISKALISSIKHSKIDDERTLISIVGQIVYMDSTQARFSHQFIILQLDSKFYIQNEIFTFLDEEVVYEEVGKAHEDREILLVVTSPNKSFSDVASFFSQFGKIRSMENTSDRKFRIKLVGLCDNAKTRDMDKICTSEGYIVNLNKN